MEKIKKVERIPMIDDVHLLNGAAMIIADPVIVSLDQLSLGVEDQILENAFGPDSLGIIVVDGLSEKFQQLRERVLASASVLASLPLDELKKLESEESTWLTGWSRGKEKLANSGLPDNLKGSFYVNCAFHKEYSLEGPTKELIEKFDDSFKAYTTPNLWPDERELTELRDFQADLKKLCSFIIDVAQLVASNCDKYIGQRVDGYEKNYLERVVRDSTCTKARLLHYYPSEGENIESGSDSWCGEHLDHSCLTGLTSAIFIDESKSLTHKLEQSPDKEAGLYIRNRNEQIVKVNIPKHCLAFQSGSTLQEVSNGAFKAVSHFVKGTNMDHIARNTLAVFCQPDLDEKVNATENFGEYANRILGGNH